MSGHSKWSTIMHKKAAKELAMIPQSTIEVPGDRAGSILRLLEALEDHDDVQKVWANLDLAEKVLAAH